MNGYDLVRLQPEQVKKAGDTMTGDLTMTNGGKFIGDLQGNADTASKLKNGVDINGTWFDGSYGITTQKWGEGRNITIGDSQKWYDGGWDIGWSLDEIGAAKKREVEEARQNKDGMWHNTLGERLYAMEVDLSNKYDKTGGEVFGDIINRNRYYMHGAVGGRAVMTKSNVPDRNELVIYADETASANGSRGSGIQLYGNTDSKHPGCIGFLVGQDDNGAIKVMIDQEGKMVVGNGIVDFTDDHKNSGQLTIKDPQDRPALYILGANETEGDIAVGKGDNINLGEWDADTNSFNEYMRITPNYCYYGGNVVPTFNRNIQTGKVTVTPIPNTPTTQTVRFATPFAKTPVITVTPQSAAPGTIVTGVGVTNVTTDGFDVVVTRTNATDTLIHWMAITD